MSSPPSLPGAAAAPVRTPASQPPYRTVLCATDLSPTGDSAVGLAYRLVADGGSVFLLHVYDPTWALRQVAPYPASSPPSLRELMETSERCAREHMDRLPFRGERLDVTTEEIMVHHPNPATAIEEQVRRTGADAVVLGTHGRTGLGRILLGSVATDVLKRTNVPVILFHDPQVRDR